MTTPRAQAFQIVSHSVGPSRFEPAVVVCVLTRARPALLAATLRSLIAQDIAMPFACIVADNDPVGADGAAVARDMLEDGLLVGAAVVVAEAGHCSASNGAFAAARAIFPHAPLIAMIDDDEEADIGWLRRLVDAQMRSGTDLVGGPVLARFERTNPARYAGHPVFQPFFAQSGPVPFLYGSGNFLMRASVLEQMVWPWFDPVFNFTGGGDFDFFLRCRDAGFTAWFEAEAVATETVPEARTTLQWVMARSMRYGTINYLIESRSAKTPMQRYKVTAKTACLLALGPVRAGLRLLASRNLLIASHPLMEAIGRAAAPFGLKPEQYRSVR